MALVYIMLQQMKTLTQHKETMQNQCQTILIAIHSYTSASIQMYTIFLLYTATRSQRS